MHTLKRGRLTALVLLAVASSILAVGCASASAAPISAASLAGSVTVDLPVVSCPTTFGVPPTRSVTLPATRAVAIPRAMASRLSVYTDSRGYMYLVAPKGWSCTALIAADGSGEVAVYPHGQKLPASWRDGWPLARTSAVSAVVGQESSACYVCTLAQACRLFPAAATAMRSYGGCPARPAAERVTRIGTGIAGFVDPPGTVGDGAPSGGQNPARGVLTYHPGSGYGSWLETCTLPAGDAAECAAIVSNYTSSYGSR
ncbi:MAG TPA: hypothetical protein VN969_47915 [Streptosporangiaceae bacterium]|jgi:hypothetical protein|nr:hypothetical protein [Streptosporangiaceae bacterium]